MSAEGGERRILGMVVPSRGTAPDGRLRPATAALLVVDIQAKLVPAMDPAVLATLVKNCRALIATAARLKLPIVVSQQYPKGLGTTIAPIAEAIAEAEAAGTAVHRFDKLEFSSAPGLPPELRPAQWIVCGMETHVCVFQTARDLAAKLDVHVVADAVCSRTKQNWKIGLELAARAGCTITSTETVIFDLMERAGTDDFKVLSKLIKQMAHAASTREIVKSLAVNVAIAVAKAVAAAISGSGAMLAETLHSFSDCANQLLLLRGVRQTARPPDAQHPLGYGRALYFYSFIVALLLFFGGGVFSIREGIEKIREPSEPGGLPMSLGILALSLALEGWSLWGNVREVRARRGATPFVRYLRETKDSDLMVVLGENTAAVLGLVVALAALVLASATGDGRWDGAGSLAIGLVLVGVASFLAREVKSLLVGEAADPQLHAVLEACAAANPDVERVLAVLTQQQGPGEVMLAMKLEMRADLTTAQLVDAINRFERAVKIAAPEVKWSFIEPDHAA